MRNIDKLFFGIMVILIISVILIGHEADAKKSKIGTKTVPLKTSSAKCKTVNGLPDAKCTPGVINKDVTQANIKLTICKPGFTKTIRPPVSVTNGIKKISMAQYGFKDSPTNYELDHLISLELGGAPKDPANLWPEPYHIANGAKIKDQIENKLNKDVCSGKINLSDAQYIIATNWLKYSKK